MLSGLLVTPRCSCVSALPCLVLFGFIKDCYLSLSTSACSSFLPAVCTVTDNSSVWQIWFLTDMILTKNHSTIFDFLNYQLFSIFQKIFNAIFQQWLYDFEIHPFTLRTTERWKYLLILKKATQCKRCNFVCSNKECKVLNRMMCTFFSIFP